jgi:hypothetical protein
MTVAFINVFDVEPSRQRELVDLLGEGAAEVIRHRPGFVSVTLLASTDGASGDQLCRVAQRG